MSIGLYVNIKQESHCITGNALTGLMEAVLERKIPFRFTALGLSMSPFIRDGDFITVAPVSYLNLRVGDVVAFVNPSYTRLTVHRILQVSRTGCLVKGDNTFEADGNIGALNIIGRVVQIEHSGRKVWMGLGAERLAIAWLSRRGLLVPNIWKVWSVIKPLKKLMTINRR